MIRFKPEVRIVMLTEQLAATNRKRNIVDSGYGTKTPREVTNLNHGFHCATSAPCENFLSNWADITPHFSGGNQAWAYGHWLNSL